LAFAPFHEAIFSDGSAVQKLSPVVQKPVSIEVGLCRQKKKGKDEIPVGAGDSKDILMESDKGYREDRSGGRKGRTRNKLRETRRKVTA
jgi:hypothetical protein